MLWKESGRLLVGSRFTYVLSSFAVVLFLTGLLPAEPCYASDCAAKLQNCFHSASCNLTYWDKVPKIILQFDLYAESGEALSNPKSPFSQSSFSKNSSLRSLFVLALYYISLSFYLFFPYTYYIYNIMRGNLICLFCPSEGAGVVLLPVADSPNPGPSVRIAGADAVLFSVAVPPQRLIRPCSYPLSVRQILVSAPGTVLFDILF